LGVLGANRVCGGSRLGRGISINSAPRKPVRGPKVGHNSPLFLLTDISKAGSAQQKRRWQQKTPKSSMKEFESQ